MMYTVKFNDHQKNLVTPIQQILLERERDIFPNDMCIYVNNALMSN